MVQKVLILVVVLITLVIGITIGLGVYYFFSNNNLGIIQSLFNTEVVSKNIEKPSLVPSDLERVKKEFPEFVTGIIKISEKKATISDENGREYIIVPERPQSMYDYVGIKSGQKIEIQGKFLDEDTIEAGSIKPI
jgi:hypothetical protein